MGNLVWPEFTLSDISGAVGVVIVGIMTLLEVSKIPVNPWSAVGRLINHAVLEEQKALKTEVTKTVGDINKKIAELSAYMEESEIKAARMRIQRFADELYANVEHSKEHFDLILMDITAYNNYCDEHSGFVNEKTKVAQEIILEIYEKLLREQKFKR